MWGDACASGAATVRTHCDVGRSTTARVFDRQIRVARCERFDQVIPSPGGGSVESGLAIVVALVDIDTRSRSTLTASTACASVLYRPRVSEVAGAIAGRGH